MEREEQLAFLPERPGVYIYRDTDLRVLYVGKAVNLKARVRQYFQSSRSQPAKVQLMVPQIAHIEHIVTHNEVEALILESNLIKRLRPKYNIRLRDDKNYPYLRLTVQEPWPRLLIARQMRRDGALYFGPYTTSQAVYDTLKLMRRLFPMRTCNDPTKYPRACLQYHIGRCLAPCLSTFDRHEEYAQAVKDAAAFLSGKTDEVLGRLQERMAAAAEKLEYERAAELRDQIRAVQKVTERQKVISRSMRDQDIIAYARERNEACIQVFFVRQGKLVGRDQFLMQGADGLTGGEIVEAFIQQHYTRTNFIPSEILTSDAVANAKLLAQWLGQKRGGAVAVETPRRGERRKLVELVAENAAEAMSERRRVRERDLAATEGAVGDLQRELKLAQVPARIECFDISHLQGQETVGAMTVFVDGVPRPSEYRKFKLRVDQNDDYANMAEVVTRRFRRGLQEREAALRAAEAPGTYRFGQFPDLLIIDGGKGQLSAAVRAMESVGIIDIPVFGLAEGEELLYAPERSEPIVLPRASPALFLLQRLRDETHRFAVSYHRQRYRKSMSRSILDDAPGIGPKRKQNLLQAFGSLRRLKEASAEELAAVPGMNRGAALQLMEFLEQQES